MERASSLHNDRFRNKGANGEDRFEIVVKEFEQYQSNIEASLRLFQEECKGAQERMAKQDRWIEQRI